MFKSAKKEDYNSVAVELGLDITNAKTIFDLVNLIKESENYKSNPTLVEEIANNIIEERKSDESNLLDLEKLKTERIKAELELAKIRTENKNDFSSDLEKRESVESLDSLIKSIRTLTIKIPIRPEGWSYFFSSLERAFISKNVPNKYKAEILLNLLGERATNVITYIKDDELGDYSKVKAIVIREFEPTPQTCLEHFRKTQRQPNETYVQFASRLTTSWDYYLKLRNVTNFEDFKQLMVSDKICQTLDKEVMCFINVRQADSWFKPIELGKEIDLYHTSRGKPVVDNYRSNNKNAYDRNVSKVFLTNVKNSKCILSCNEFHPLYKCPVYKNMSVNERVRLVKSKNLCFNCLMNHRVIDCRSKISCKYCNRRHNFTLHFPREQNVIKVEGQEMISQEMTHERNSNQSNLDVSAPVFQPLQGNNQSNLFSRMTCNLANELKAVLLSTFICLLKDELGNFYEVRGLLDVGATSNYMSSRLADKLNLKREKINISISGINDLSLNIKSRVSATILNREKDFDLKLSFLVVPKITEFTPSRPLNSCVSSLKNIKLADEKFNVPGPIDLLLGAEIFYELLKPGQIYPQNTNIVLQNSIFGYIVSGSLPAKGGGGVYCGLITDNSELEKTVKAFWEIEHIERESEISAIKETNICEEHFLRNYSRIETGQYMVKMPLKEDPSCLGESKKGAMKCLNSLWYRLGKDPIFYELYKKFMQEYLNMGHMEEVIESEEPDIKYYIPHHSVFRPESTTTPLRVVFNASALTSTGKSINCLQFNGGTIQDDLTNIMFRFRLHQFVFVADIKKMYRMILIHPSQRNLLRILFKPEVNEPVKVYKLCTVTYGTTSAPFLATRTLQQLAKDEGNDFPLAASVLLRDVYMDDILTGADDLNIAKEIQQQLIALLARAGMELHKWSANNQFLMCNELDSEYSFSKDTKTLGILWKPQTDCFGFNLVVEQSDKYTKRSVLSQIARIFDPLGLIGPIITRAKVFLQKLWMLKIDWCDSLPLKESTEWTYFLNSLKSVNSISIPRCVLIEQYISAELHGFADASEIAYGAAIYVKSINSCGDSVVKLLTSKSRVAPLKCVTIPRLELCAAVLLTKLMKKVVTALQLEISKTCFWTDSTIVLAWLRKESKDLKTFVSNRVSIIQNLSLVEQWHHVSSKQNPADIISRGIDPQELTDCALWWRGPECLVTNSYPDRIVPDAVNKNDYTAELKGFTDCNLINLNITVEDFVNTLLHISNSYLKIIRVLSFIFRFVENCKQKEKKTGPIESSELKRAQVFLVKLVQEQTFKEELGNVRSSKKCSKSSFLNNLNPFIDKNGLLRVGGRLSNSNLSYDKKFPIFLPSKHRLTELIVNYFHLKYLHSGPQALLHQIRQQFWIINGRSRCRKIVHDCVTCFKAKPQVMEQQMADLPEERVRKTFPFNISGADFCGPFYIKYRGQRKGTFHKIYICIFICFVSKAIHLEIVSDMTSAAFIAALKRFIFRRGKCAKLFTDNAKNFVGANFELKKLQKLVKQPDETLAAYMASEGIDWKFLPPRAPNFGGIWEAGVKSIKYYLKRVVGNLKLTYEEFLTVLIQVEGMLNSRPLVPLSADIDDVNVLTPSHFLIGRPITSMVEPDLTNIVENRLDHWQNLTKIMQKIWKKWSSDYLSNLQQRNKWKFEKDNVKVGDLVVVREDNLPPCQWSLGRICEIFPGKDLKVRVVEVKTALGKYKRPVSKLCLLPMNE